ncbi:MAG: DUF3473 domain-containing protein [Magnetococcus sp. DMHC-6]
MVRRNKKINALTIDVEDYFQVFAFEEQVHFDTWESRESRVEENTLRILDLLGKGGVQATFFMLGWVAQRHPKLCRRILEQGHELASHGWRHIRADRQTPEAFYDDVYRTRMTLEEIGGVAVLGYRAATYSIGAGNLWALEVLKKAGYRYSSSIYPIRHDFYGMPEASRWPFWPRVEGVVEIPVATAEIFGRRLPCGGGGYFRLFPYDLSRWAWQRLNQVEDRSGVFYFHPWELDPGQPRLSGVSVRTRLRHYLNLTRMEARLGRLLGDFSWDRMDRVFSDVIFGKSS